MSFKLLLYAPDGHPEQNLQTWPETLRDLIPGIDVTVAESEGEAIAVSYTHLTLPTSDLV